MRQLEADASRRSFTIVQGPQGSSGGLAGPLAPAQRWYFYLASPADAPNLDLLGHLLAARDLFSELSGAAL